MTMYRSVYHKNKFSRDSKLHVMGKGSTDFIQIRKHFSKFRDFSLWEINEHIHEFSIPG